MLSSQVAPRVERNSETGEFVEMTNDRRMQYSPLGHVLDRWSCYGCNRVAVLSDFPELLGMPSSWCHQHSRSSGFGISFSGTGTVVASVCLSHPSNDGDMPEVLHPSNDAAMPESTHPPVVDVPSDDARDSDTEGHMPSDGRLKKTVLQIANAFQNCFEPDDTGESSDDRE